MFVPRGHCEQPGAVQQSDEPGKVCVANGAPQPLRVIRVLNRPQWSHMKTATLVFVLVAAGMQGCGNPGEPRPQARATPEAVCTPATPVPPTIRPCGGAACQPATLTVRVEADGKVSKVSIAGSPSPEFRACLEREVGRLSFAPAKTCAGNPVAADWKQELLAICDPL